MSKYYRKVLELTVESVGSSTTGFGALGPTAFAATDQFRPFAAVGFSSATDDGMPANSGGAASGRNSD